MRGRIQKYKISTIQNNNNSLTSIPSKSVSPSVGLSVGNAFVKSDKKDPGVQRCVLLRVLQLFQLRFQLSKKRGNRRMDSPMDGHTLL